MSLRQFWGASLKFCTLVAKRFDEDGCFYRAAALAYTTLLSLVPLLAVSFASLTVFPLFQSLGNQVQNFVFKNFIPAAAETVQGYLQQFLSQVSHLSVIGLFALIFTAITVLYTIEQTFNTIWRVHKPRRRMLALLLYWAVLTLAPLVIGLGFAASNHFLTLPWVAQFTQTFSLSGFIFAIVPFFLTATAFSALYIVIPNCPVRIRDGLIGGMVAAIFFETAKFGFSLYIKMFPTYELIYGALAAIPVFLVWIYLCWLIILLGAEISHAISN